MALENYVRQDWPKLKITNMKAFSAELTKELSKAFHISENYEIPILTEKEYIEKVDADSINAATVLSGDGCLPSLFNKNLEAAIITDAYKNYPIAYGEELAHGLRHHTYEKWHPGEQQRPVQEFFGWLGAEETFFILQDLLNGLPCAYHPADVNDMWKAKKHASAKLRQIERDIELCHANGIDDGVLRKKEEYLASEIQHATGYAVASVARTVAEDDAKLFYRSDEEVWHIYFEPVRKYDWSKYAPNNPKWLNVRDKVLRKIRRRVEGS